MCTLIVGNHVLGPGTVVVGANRDEDPSRPSDPPGVLQESPRLVGGRDRRAGGTWLAVRERRAVVAMLNRRDQAGPEARAGGGAPRSRGLLTLDVASAAPARGRAGAGDLAAAAQERALAAVRDSRYAPFSLAFLSPLACWVMTHDGDGEPRVERVSSGWHVLTHADLDDPAEPRTARLMRELTGFRPGSFAEAERGMLERLRLHGAPAGDGSPAGEAAVCIHEGAMVTVSCSVVCLAPGEARYLHAEGRPCEQPALDCSALLAGESVALERT